MARRKAEVVEDAPTAEEVNAAAIAKLRAQMDAEAPQQWASEAERIEAMPDRWAEVPAGADYFVEVKDRWSHADILRENMERRQAALDALTARLSAIPSMTDRAAINALAEAVADLARLMR